MQFFTKVVIAISITNLAVILGSNATFAQEKLAESIQINQEENLISQNIYSRPKNKENYIGGGLLLGGEGDFVDFAVISKVKLFNLGSWGTISTRPSVTFTDGDVGFRVPATIDWRNLRNFNNKVVPFAGVGAAIDSDGDADLMLMGGTDYKLSRDWTVNGGVNVLFLGDTTVDVTLGIGYNF